MIKKPHAPDALAKIALLAASGQKDRALSNQSAPQLPDIHLPQFSEGHLSVSKPSPPQTEMEHLVRVHACVVIASLISEPFPAQGGDKSHHHLMRAELEGFFIAATQAIRVENPDRQIKPIDGDYEPPGPGLPDNHCYAGWYNGHGLDLGELHKGSWLPVKAGWNYAGGEFGSEGLDFEEVMRSRYPADWLPIGPEDEMQWTPARIHKCQTGYLHYLWMEAAGSMSGWIERSQAHQAWITKLMTEAFRRDNRMIGFEIHLFIDAWPAGWMKTIMDCRRHPKPDYFAYRKALAPLAVSCRMDRTSGCSGECIEAEAWICNDHFNFPSDVELFYQLERNDRVIRSAKVPARIRANEAVFQGRIQFELPAVVQRETTQLRLGLISGDGRTLHDTSQSIEVFPVLPVPEECGTPSVVGERKAALLASELVINCKDAARLWIVVDDPAALNDNTLLASIAADGTALLIEMPPGVHTFADSKINVEVAGMEKRHFVARAPAHPISRLFGEDDFRFWYDPELDRPAPLLETVFFIDASWLRNLLTGQGGWGREWVPALAAAEKPYGAGRVILCQLALAGRLVNPAARHFANALISRATDD